MKLFNCDQCGQPVFFENYFCVHCNAALGFDAARMDLISLEPVEGDLYKQAGQKTRTKKAAPLYKYCSNKQYNVCNWLVAPDSVSGFCVACDLNRTIPNLSQPDHWVKWQQIEVAKHRLVYSLLRLNLPVVSKFVEENGIAFDFKADDAAAEGRLLTGHNHGLITLNIEEADDAIREMARNQMDEVYRTVLGHFRHEIGHYYWDRLVFPTAVLPHFRELFGDETIDYGEALKQHYAKEPSDAWRETFISAYASSHPWEDWAETWAHYLHMVDSLETAYAFGMTLKPRVSRPENEMTAKLNIDPYTTQNFNDIIERWFPLTFAMNSLNRSMGLKDPYPFVINEAVRVKLNFIHDTVRNYSSLVP